MGPNNREFDITGINHLALVCKDMKRTVDFYSNVLGMPLVKTLDLPEGLGQHFFFDLGNGVDRLAFFWFADAPEAAPGVASPSEIVGLGSGLGGMGDFRTAHGSMNHVAFNVPPARIEEYRRKLQAKGIEVSEIFNHDDSPTTMSPEVNRTTWVRSIYFRDPDGIMLEFAAWTREFGEGDVRHEPRTAADAVSPLRSASPTEMPAK